LVHLRSTSVTERLRKQTACACGQEQGPSRSWCVARTKGKLLTREELRQRVWPEDTFVGLRPRIAHGVQENRAALNDEADSPRTWKRSRGDIGFIAPVPNGGDAGTPRGRPSPKKCRNPRASRLEKLDALSHPGEQSFYSRPELTGRVNRRVECLLRRACRRGRRRPIMEQ